MLYLITLLQSGVHNTAMLFYSLKWSYVGYFGQNSTCSTMYATIHDIDDHLLIFSVTWLRFCVFISSEKVSFVGVRGNSYPGDISLDEVSVSDAEECKTSGPKQGDVGRNPKEGEYVIYSGDGQTELFFVERCRISPNGLMKSVFSAHVNTACAITTPCQAIKPFQSEEDWHVCPAVKLLKFQLPPIRSPAKLVVSLP